MTITHKGHSGSPRWKASGRDIPGNMAYEYWPIAGSVTNRGTMVRFYLMDHLMGSYRSFGNWSDSVQTASAYNTLGHQCFSGSADGGSGQNGTTFRGTSAVERTVLESGNWFQVTTNYVYVNADDNGQKNVASIHKEQLTGLAADELARAIDVDAYGNPTLSVTTIDRANNKITVTTSKPHTSSLDSVTVYQNGRIISASTFSVPNPAFYSYDALGRTNLIQDSQGNFTMLMYDPNTGWLTSITDPAGHTTSYIYYNTNEANAGKLKCQTDANGKKTYYAYTTRGELNHTWGDVPYPVEYRYNEYGDLTNLITFRDGTGWTSSAWPTNSTDAGDNTYWFYDAASGALTNKMDAQGRSVSYTYDTTTGRLLTRSWARTVGGVPVTVTNSYNGFSDLVSQEYNDGTPNVYFNDYNRAGQPREIIDGAGTNELTYDHASRLVSSYCSGGLLQGITVSNHFNPYFGRDKLQVSLAGGWTLEDDYGYDSYGRLGSVTCGTDTATYGFVPSSDLLQSTTFKHGPTTVLTTTRSWQFGFQLSAIVNVVDSTPVTAHAYQYDALNRRTQATLEDGSAWTYGYNDRNELTGAHRHWSWYAGGTPVAGQQFRYNYDTIGNRTWAQFGGDTNGNNLQTISYQANNLNQYTGITTPGSLEIIGATLATNSVTVNGGVADRRGEYFHREISVANTNQPVWQNVTNIAGTFTNKGGLLITANSQSLAYDADGNLSFDGVWTYQWDGENRLVAMTMTNVAGIANSNRLQLQFAYDYLGRRVQKVVSTWNGIAFTSPVTNKFVYDGWNLLAILNPQSSLLQSFMWGKDLSGNLQGAGGVGGLLMANFNGTDCFTAYDGNGNITSLINATDKSLAARYEYSPYGQLIRETGLLAAQMPFRFSTKFWDEESGLIYYNMRVYSSTLGRWISRDPTTDQIFLNLYLFCKNNPLSYFDPDGRSWEDFFQVVTATAAGATAGAGTGFLCSGFTPAGAGIGAIAGGINGFVSGIVGIQYGDSWGSILGHAGAAGALSGIPGGASTFGAGWGALGGTVAGIANSALHGNNTKEGYLLGAALGAVLGYTGGSAAEIDSKVLDCVLSAASECGGDAALGLWNFFEQ